MEEQQSFWDTISHSAVRRVVSEQEKKDRGMELSATNNAAILHVARLAAEKVNAELGRADITRVRRRLEKWGIDFIPGNWMGSVFKGGGWKPTGRWVHTTHEGSHGRFVREWTK